MYHRELPIVSIRGGRQRAAALPFPRVATLAVQCPVRAATAHRVDTAVPPTRRLRPLISLFIAAHLAWQVVVPLGYYLRQNERDERFAWRIFSALAIAPYRCDVRVQEFAAGERTGREVDLSRTLHDAWAAALRLGHDAVVDRFLQARCRSSSVIEAVEFSRVCRRPDRAPAPYMRVRLDCLSGAVSAQEEL
jgi:hypothetical protein